MNPELHTIPGAVDGPGAGAAPSATSDPAKKPRKFEVKPAKSSPAAAMEEPHVPSTAKQATETYIDVRKEQTQTTQTSAPAAEGKKIEAKAGQSSAAEGAGQVLEPQNTNAAPKVPTGEADLTHKDTDGVKAVPWDGIPATEPPKVRDVPDELNLASTNPPALEKKSSKDELLENKLKKKGRFVMRDLETTSITTDEAKEAQAKETSKETNAAVGQASNATAAQESIQRPTSAHPKPISPNHQTAVKAEPGVSMNEQLQSICQMNAVILKRLETLLPGSISTGVHGAHPRATEFDPKSQPADVTGLRPTSATVKDVPHSSAPSNSSVAGNASRPFSTDRSKDKNFERLRNYLNEMKVELEQAAAERGQAEIIHRNLKERNTILEKRLEEEKNKRAALDKRLKAEQKKFAQLKSQLETLSNSSPVVRNILTQVESAPVDSAITMDPKFAASVPGAGHMPLSQSQYVESGEQVDANATTWAVRPEDVWPTTTNATHISASAHSPAAHTSQVFTSQSSANPAHLIQQSPSAPTTQTFDFLPHPQAAQSHLNGVHPTHYSVQPLYSTTVPGGETEDGAAIAMRTNRPQSITAPSNPPAQGYLGSSAAAAAPSGMPAAAHPFPSNSR